MLMQEFDCDALRNLFNRKDVVANIYVSTNVALILTDFFIDDELYAQRYSIERTNALIVHRVYKGHIIAI